MNNKKLQTAKKEYSDFLAKMGNKYKPLIEKTVKSIGVPCLCNTMYLGFDETENEKKQNQIENLKALIYFLEKIGLPIFFEYENGVFECLDI